jgi:DNA-binding transcriptional LysR family regulator
MSQNNEIFRTITNLAPAELSAFAAVARHGGFRAASRAIGVSPSALSHSVAALEAKLNVQLFVRTTRNVSLTEAGTRFHKALSPALTQLQHAVSIVTDFSDRPAGLIRINAATSAAEMVLRPIIVGFLEENPEMHIEIVSEDKLVDIAQDGFDCGIRARDLVPAEMVAVPIGPELRHIVVASPAYLADAAPLHSPADLSQHHCIQLRLPSGQIYRWEFERRGEGFAVETRGRLVLTTSPQIRQAALAGLGLGYVSQSAVVSDLANSALVRVLADWTPPYPGLCLYYPRHRHLSAGLRAFISFARRTDSGQNHL